MHIAHAGYAPDCLSFPTQHGNAVDLFLGQGLRNQGRIEAWHTSGKTHMWSAFFYCKIGHSCIRNGTFFPRERNLDSLMGFRARKFDAFKRIDLSGCRRSFLFVLIEWFGSRIWYFRYDLILAAWRRLM